MLRELALFAGGAGGILGSLLSGFRTECAVENDPRCIESLLRRQKDGCLPTFPIWDDVRTFDGRHWKGDIEVVTGGFPCTDISCAGKGDGITGSRSGLFFEMLRIIEEVRPVFVLSENSQELRTRGLGAVLTGFARLGYDARWGVLGARHVGANHWRKRLWIIAADAHRGGKRAFGINAKMARTPAPDGVVEQPSHSDSERNDKRVLSIGAQKTPKSDATSKIKRSDRAGNTTNPNSELVREQQGWRSEKGGQEAPITRVTDWWDISRFARVDDGGPNRLDVEESFAQMEMEGMAEEPRDRNARVVMTGNMQVPIVAALAWEILTGYRRGERIGK